MMYLARMHQLAGDRDAARAVSEAILRLSDAHRLRAVEHYAAIIRAWAEGDRDGVAANLDALRKTGGLLRQYFPKGTSLASYSQGDLNKIALQLNQRPRKTLGFMTPADKLNASMGVAFTD
ncbi:hypothetical protein WM34_26515 [Burkholderia ubonensis]|nr:hypothetical protein WK46_22820 [Burkholderia ubonensis]KWD12303.1 hypothetical protein WL59_31910 [Burkholderia ubonensis]KWD16903.1 hypothetical protein WL60_09935 [Burkholderia ubonensis]KWQ02217.1 hypothetical protein WM34_26515 [Burkholderia ubonensis]